MDFRMSAFTVAATVLLAASCAGTNTKQVAESSDIGNSGDETRRDTPVERTSNADRNFVETPFELAPDIRQACLPYRLPQPHYTLRPDSDLREELDGLTNCLVSGPLYDKDLQIVHPDPAKSYFDGAVDPLRQALIDAGINAYRLRVVPTSAANREAAGLTLRLASTDAES